MPKWWCNPLNSKERVLTALAHAEPDRIPFSLGFGLNPPVLEELASVLGLPDAAAALAYCQRQSDFVSVAPPYIGPSSRNHVAVDGTATDIWGIQRKPVSYGAGCYDEITYYPLAAVDDLSALSDYLFPNPDWFDYGALPRLIRDAQANGHRAVMLGIANLFETSWYMRGLDHMLMDLLLRPDFAHALMERVTSFYAAYLARSLAAANGGIDIVFTADDIGQQHGLLMSLAVWRAHIKPYHQRINRLVHSWHAKVMYHTDGAVMEAVEDLIDMGIDILEALQFDAAGMDPVALKRRFGERLCFHGGISVQTTLPFQSAGAVTQEVLERIRVLGDGGGYILAPSHAIQAGTPADNILAFFQAAGRPLR